MRKYLAYWRINLQSTLAYRGPMVIWLTSNMVTLIMFVSLWLSAETTGGDIAGYSKNQLVTYYLCGLLLQWIVGWLPFYWLKDEIKNGDIAGNILTKPVMYYWRTFFIESGWHVISIWGGLLAVLIMGYFLFPYISLSLNFIQLIEVILAVVIAIFITFTVSLCMSLTAFWLTHVDALDGIFWAGRSILGGEGVPIALFPVGILSIVNFLPFRYMYSFPLEVLLEKLSTSEIGWGFVGGTIWIGIFICLYKLLWNEGLKSYASAGV